MASPLSTLLENLRILRSAKDYVKHFPRHWASLLAYLGRKLSEWRCLWLTKPGTFRNPKPAEPSLPGSRSGLSSALSSSISWGGDAVAASMVPASAGRPSHQRAVWHPATAPPSPTGSPARLSVDPTWASSLNLTNQFVQSSPAFHSTGNLSIQSASDRRSIITTSHQSLRSSVRNDWPLRAPRGTYRQFGPGPAPSRLSRRSSRSPSPMPSPNIAQPQHLVVDTLAHADGRVTPTISPQSPTALPSSTSHTQGQLCPPAFRRGRQRTTSIDVSVRSPSPASVPNASSINAQEFPEGPKAMDTSSLSSPLILPADRLETVSPTTSFAASDILIPDGRLVQLINSDQIPRYTKNVTMQVHYSIIALQPLRMFTDLVREDCKPWNR